MPQKKTLNMLAIIENVAKAYKRKKKSEKTKSSWHT
jgi:hypothetical protein